MAYLLVERGCQEKWVVVSLEGEVDALFLTGDRERPLLASDGEQSPHAAGYIYRHPSRSGDIRWKLYIGTTLPILVNGTPLALGSCLLNDRDEIRVGSCGRMIFSADVPAAKPASKPAAKHLRPAACT